MREPTKVDDVKALGELEERIMRAAWKRSSPVTVREVHEQLSKDPKERKLAYTTVMTVMDRLYRKGLLRRERRGRAFAYSPAISEAEHTAGLMQRLLTGSRDRRKVLAHFLGGMKKADEAELLRLADEASRRDGPR